MTIQPLTATASTSLPAENDWPEQGQWRYEDYLWLPDDGKRYEIIEGVLYVANAPSFDHQFVVGEVFAYLRHFVREQYGVAEYWLVAPKLHGIEVYTLSNGEYALLGQYTGDELIESSVLAGLQIKAAALFQPAPSQGISGSEATTNLERNEVRSNSFVPF